MRMVVPWLAWLLACGCASPPVLDADAARSQPTGVPGLTLDRILSGPALTGTAPSDLSWSPDSTRLAFRWNDQAGSRREIWMVEADGDQLRRLTSDTEGASSVGELSWLPDGRGLVYLRSAELWRTDLAGESLRLAAFAGGPSNLAVSPDGRHASVLLDGDLWLVDLLGTAALGSTTGTIRRLTELSVPSISNVAIGRYRRPDVEIGSYVWGGPTYAWSPDSRSIAVHYVDRREVRAVPFPHYLGDETDPNLVRRGYPGDPNERRMVGLLQVEDGELTFLDLPDPTSTRVVDFSWSSNAQLLIDRESDTAVDRWLHVLDLATGDLRELWHDHRPTRVYTTAGSAWHPDGEHVIVLGDLGDRYGLYSLSFAAPEPGLLSDPAYDVTGGPVLAANGAIFYPSNQPNPYEQQVFRTELDGGEPIRLTRQPGTAQPSPSPDGTRMAVLHSDDVSPTELYLVDAISGGGARRVTRSPPSDFAEHSWAKAHYVSFPSLVDDATLHARVLTPRNLQPGRRYPVLFGPVYSNTVRNRWAGFYGTFQQLLVQRGFVVVQVDVRGSTGYGRAFREQFLTDFAGRDLDDLESAVTYLETLSYVDPGRIGIWGSSYGGTLTVYALLKKPGLFDAGVACAAAVDPRFFGGDDVAIVRRPDSHPDAFLRGAAQYAANLQDPLLLIHGMQDQVVPFKTVVVLAEELMRRGKDFDFAFAPAGTHGWTSPPHYARYLLGKLIAHFERHLAAPGPRSQ